MKMPSTYISLLLLCGLMLLFYYNKSNYNTTHATNLRLVKENRPVVKRISPVGPIAVPLNKNRNNGNSRKQDRLKENSFSFFKDILPDLVPVLKNY
jgi:hypothetical protein